MTTIMQLLISVKYLSYYTINSRYFSIPCIVNSQG